MSAANPVTHFSSIKPVQGPSREVIAALVIVGVALVVIGLVAHQLAAREASAVLLYKRAIIVSAVGATLACGGLALAFAHELEHQRLTYDIQQLIKSRLGWDLSDVLMDKVWQHVLKTEGLELPDHCDRETFERIEGALRSHLIYSGPGISSAFDQSQPAGQMLHFLASGHLAPGVLSRKFLSAICCQENLELSATFTTHLQRELYRLAANLPQRNQEALYDAYVGHLLGLIPFAYPQRGERFVIPIKVNGAWRACNYQLDTIFSLSPSWFPSPIPALGLISEEGPPLMLFLGSTYPAGQGASATYLADFTPALSVGHMPYLCGSEELSAWLEGKQQVQLAGISLGGATALHVLRHHRAQVGKVQIFNPAGLYPWDYNSQPYDAGAEVHIYGHEGDLVSTMGYFPEGRNVHLYTLIAGDTTQSCGTAHMRIYSSAEQVTLLKMNMRAENARAVRHLLTALHVTLGPLLLGLPLLLFQIGKSLTHCRASTK